MDQESRFETLSTIGKIISALGWLTAGGGSFVALSGLIVVVSGRRGSLQAAILVAAPGFLVAVGGMLVVSAGQLISCFIAIEANTRAASSVLESYLNGHPGWPRVPDSGPHPASSPVPAPATPSAAPSSPGQAAQNVTCPKCNESESVKGLYDVSQYHRFEAIDKSNFGFQSLSLTCRRCGQTFRI